ncbi:transporter [Dictyobacter alpinus]|uniref:Transporter n=1 Tax=Dictyobacter alpinus TaxID=2014873 RepID=A0A402B2H0_9CHLR|nr:AzlC family ABC transporter permease [Dictyobacter alpinus]GCE25528.1 transporter [Dictyobacter alpinus]
MSETDTIRNTLAAQTPVNFGYAGALAGMKRALPLAIGGCVYGLIFGILARQSHLSMLEVLLMSGLVYAGSAQFAVLSLWNMPFAFEAILLTTLLVNARNLLLGITLHPWLSRLPPFKVALTVFFLADENWALTMNEFARGGRDAAFLLGSGVVLFVEWLISTSLGWWIGEGITDPAHWGLDFAFTAVFLTLLVGVWKGKADSLPWIVAALVAVVSAHLLPGTWYILLGAFAGSAVGVIRHAD